ncbi:glycosyltransferase family 4 protein [Psychroserpens sp. SPM9]|uniref:glycosyltransferase family 4 protein n=1 Tax=Psychroserpens sp. SPM9 TaxID=2975598 RepID=UPI0021A7D968|nr:glycosyltransferase family 4 protein [Psychroserpens sp. SPM9]MDG5492233.1 glycosyltransferase family 4 protein [Psychroserpens sp. SPM9]
MHQNKGHKLTIGLVLSTVPKYSETFFRNKIKGLQANGFEVILFVDYATAHDDDFLCDCVVAPNFGKSKLTSISYSIASLFKSLFKHPKRSYKLFKLDKQDGLSFNKCFRNLIVNEFLLTRDLDWLHFGFGMLSVNRENIAKAIGAKMAVSFRGFDLYLSPLKHQACYKYLFQKAVKYHVLSNEMKTDLTAYHISEKQIEVIPPAIDVNVFQTDKKQSINDNVIQLVTVARLHWKKGLEYTLEALQLLKEKGVKFHYTIIGDGSEYERLIFAAYQLGLKDHVTFKGKLPQIEVKHCLEQSDIYLQYSIQEGFCNAVLEAQAMGLMTIVSNAEGLSENVLDGQTGWVVPKRQPRVLAEKIEAVIQMNQNEKQAIRTFAISRVREEFNLKKQNTAFVKFYED